MQRVSTARAQGDPSALDDMQLSQLFISSAVLASPVRGQGEQQQLRRGQAAEQSRAEQSQRESADGTEGAQNAATAPRHLPSPPLSVCWLVRREEKSRERGAPFAKEDRRKKEKKKREERKRERKAAAEKGSISRRESTSVESAHD